MNVEYQMHNSNLSPSLSFTDTMKILIEVNHFIISTVLSPVTGDLQFPGFSMVLVLAFCVFLMVGARLMLRGARDCDKMCTSWKARVLICGCLSMAKSCSTCRCGGDLFVHPTTVYCPHACSQSLLVMSCIAFVF